MQLLDRLNALSTFPGLPPIRPADSIEASRFVRPLTRFIGTQQIACLADMAAGEEDSFAHDTVARLGRIVATMPASYDTDGQGEEALVYLHYFKGSADWWITERDRGSRDDHVRGVQHQAFGYARLFPGTEPEAGYISIAELIQHQVELDFHWRPRPWRRVRKSLFE